VQRRRAEREVERANHELMTHVSALQTRSQQLALLGHIGELLQACQTREEAAELLSNSAPAMFSFARGGLFRVAPSRNLVTPMASWPDPAEPFAPSDCWAIRRGAPHESTANVTCGHLARSTAERYRIILESHEDCGFIAGCAEVAGLVAHGDTVTDAIDKLPSQLSGGMRKRAGLARALALDPPLLFLDEPTAGLDPIAAGAFDALIKELQSSLSLTVMMITHDLDTLYEITDRVAVLADRKVVAAAPVRELERSDHPWIKEYFLGPRGRAAAAARHATMTEG